MTNERLRAAITEAGFTHQTFSEQIDVDPKTVERWIGKDRVPHRATRMRISALLKRSESFLWPATDADPRTTSATRAEFVDLHPSRGTVPVSTWVDLIDRAAESIDLLAFAGSFLEDSVPRFVPRLAERAAAGVRVRLLFGDPDSDAVATRGAEEGIGELMAARCRLTWTYLAPLLGQPGVEARQHGSTLYASLFRFDNTLLVNPHAYGAAASHSPVLHLERIPGGRLFDHYLESFDRTWQAATPV